MNYKVGDLLEVLWLDAIGDNGPWHLQEDYDYSDHANQSPCEAVGYFLKKNKNHLFISQLHRPVDHMVSRVFSIPLKCVIKIKKRG